MSEPTPEERAQKCVHETTWGARILRIEVESQIGAAVAAERERAAMVVLDGDWDEGPDLMDTLVNIAAAIREEPC